MKISNLTFALLLTALLLVSGSGFARQHNGNSSSAGNSQPGVFDYYLLSLSWSPEFCTTPAGQKPEKQQQCSAHYGFVIHGLWPQNNNSYPENCGAAAQVPPDVAAIVLSGALQMPPGDSEFIDHEWSTHGTCSGLEMTQYFQAIKATAAAVKIPDVLNAPTQPVSEDFNTIAQQFSDNNQGLTADMIEVKTDNQGNVGEIHLCFNKQLTSFQTCTNNNLQNGGTFLPVQ